MPPPRVVVGEKIITSKSKTKLNCIAVQKYLMKVFYAVECLGISLGVEAPSV